VNVFDDAKLPKRRFLQPQRRDARFQIVQITLDLKKGAS
jgi:hypothetical protein